MALFSVLPMVESAVVIDGQRSEEESYGTPLVQETPGNWGEGNALANLSATSSSGILNVFVAGSAQDNAILVFLDTKPGGEAFIPNTLITQGGEENTINNLGASASAGLRFETGFAADYAVRIYGAGADAYVNTYDFSARSRTYAGEAGGNNLSNGFINDIFVNWQPVAPGDYATSTTGVEMALSLPGLGVPNGIHPVKMVAVLVNGASDYGSNQTLGSRTSATNDLAAGIRSFSFEDEPGVQILEVSVDNSDSDGDGIPDSEDPDDDNDGLLDTYETNTGAFVSPTSTGSSPVRKDTDGDGLLDGAEVAGSALAYISNPNIPNYTAMTVPGTFNTPTAWTPTSGANLPPTDMTQGDSSSLISQYQWSLDYPFPAAGPVQYKFAAGSWTSNWGAGASPNSAVAGTSTNFSTTLSASGLHRIFFDQAALTHSLTRLVFPNASNFLDAYGLSAGGDEDGDTIPNENEFAANTDPRNPDTDGDGLSDSVESGSGIFASASDTGTHPLKPDTDEDGLSDGAETNTGTFTDAAHTGTSPHRTDSDADGEGDNLEVFQGTDPTRATDSSAVAGRPLVDGMRDTVYGAPLSVQTIETGFGDNLNEWNAAYARLAGGKLSLLLTGNLGDTFNKLEVFIDSQDGGSSSFVSAGNDGSTAMNGMTFDAGFAPEYHLIIRRGVDGGSGKFDIDFADLTTATFSTYTRVFAASSTGRGATGTDVNTRPILVAYVGSNTAGIGGTSGVAADQAAASAVTTGLEVCLDLADLGSPTSPIRIMALQNNDSHSFLSNQSLAGLPVGTGNLGDPTGVDFSAFDGDQFFTVGAPATPDFRITTVERLPATNTIGLTVAGLVPGTRYKVVESPALTAPFTDVAGSEFTATTTSQTLIVAGDGKPRNYFKVSTVP